jgi:hypothetical protein
MKIFTPIRRASAWPWRTLLTALPIAMLLLMPGPGFAQTADLPEWQVDPMRGPVDMGLTDPSLIGAIDVHLHLDPDSPGAGGVIRAIDVFDAATIAMSRGMRGFVFKTHQVRQRRLSGAQAPLGDFRDFRPHGPELLHGRDQCRHARAFLASKGRLGPHL